MNEQEDDLPQESDWPSVDLAYEFVAPSYDWIQRRFESVERRIQTFLAFTATLTLGLPTLMIVVNRSADFGSGWFIGAMVAAVLILALGIAAKFLSGDSGIRFPSPGILYRRWMHFTELEFKRNAIYWAGQHFDANVSLINKMGRILTGMICLFAVEVILLLIWAVVSLT